MLDDLHELNDIYIGSQHRASMIAVYHNYS